MKAKTTLLVSVVLNLGLVVATAYVFTRSSADPVVAASTAAPTGGGVSAKKASVSNIVETNVVTVKQQAESNFSWRLVESPEYKTYIANLRSIKCPEDTIRDIIVADVNKLYAAKFRALQKEVPQLNQYWASDRPRRGISQDFGKKYRALEREKSNLLKELLGIDPIKEEQRENGWVDWQERQYSFLPQEKWDKMQDLQEKYNDLEQEIYQRYGDGTIHSDEQKELYDLRKKRLADAAQFLTPQEFEDYDMRTSQIGSQLRSDLDAFDPSEEEFRKIYAARKKYEDELSFYPDGSDTDANKRRQKAVDESNKEIKAVLGDDRYAQYDLAQKYEYRELAKLTERLDLPKESALEVYDMKKTAEDQAREVRNNKSLNKEQRQTALKAIQEETQKAVTEKIGERGYTNYKGRGGYWIQNLAR